MRFPVWQPTTDDQNLYHVLNITQLATLVFSYDSAVSNHLINAMWVLTPESVHLLAKSGSGAEALFRYSVSHSYMKWKLIYSKLTKLLREFGLVMASVVTAHYCHVSAKGSILQKSMRYKSNTSHKYYLSQDNQGSSNTTYPIFFRYYNQSNCHNLILIN